MIAKHALNGLDDRLARLVERALENQPAARAEALDMLRGGDDAPFPLLPLAHAAGLVRRAAFGNRVQVHLLNNVQSGACPEDCGYCGQAKTSDAPIQAYRLKPREQIIAEAQSAKDAGAFRYCMVLSGRGPSDADIDHMVECIREVKRRFGLQTCLSAGLLDRAKAERLRAAGLDRLNHNLNTSRERYPEICTTHTFQDRVDTLGAARGAGLQLCSGLIVGMGETSADLVSLAFELRELEAESIPVNFLVPIPGNEVVRPVLDGARLTPRMCLRVLCMNRFVNPRAELRVAAGREGHLRSLQPLAMEPANSLFVDGYLLTRGSDALRTLRMLRDAGFEIQPAAEWPEALRKAALEGDLDDFAIERDESAAPSGCDVLKADKVNPKRLAKLRVNGALPE